MGFWGFELYQNDTSLDIKDTFDDLLEEGKTAEEIFNILLEDYAMIMGDIDEEPWFWLTLADIQCDLGMLLPIVKAKALYWVEECTKAFHCNETNKMNAKKTFFDLKTKILSFDHQQKENPNKKTTKRKTYSCQWKIGDVFAYQLESSMAIDRGLYGRYFLIQKIDESKASGGTTVPIVYVKITPKAKLPLNVEEYNKMEYVQTSFSKYEHRFWPIDMRRPEEDIIEKSKINYQVDDFGFLPEYRAVLLNTSKNIIPSKLIYVGNFIDASSPLNEFVPHSKDNIVSLYWNRFDETFETKLIKSYFGHNLRELEVYKKKT